MSSTDRTRSPRRADEPQYVWPDKMELVVSNARVESGSEQREQKPHGKLPKSSPSVLQDLGQDLDMDYDMQFRRKWASADIGEDEIYWHMRPTRHLACQRVWTFQARSCQ